MPPLWALLSAGVVPTGEGSSNLSVTPALASVSRVISRLCLRVGRKKPEEGDRYNPPAGITPRCSESAHLKERPRLYSSLFKELSTGGLNRCLARVNKSSGEGKVTPKWISGALDQEQLKATSPEAEREDIRGERRARVFITMHRTSS